MGFVAGILLMYLPEQHAFQVFSQLMSSKGCKLRRLYLDGLCDLKYEMSMFDWLLKRHHPKLSCHLQQYCVPSVLYISQWLLTCFACPFPAYFTAQLVDIMLIEGSDRIIMQVFERPYLGPFCMHHSSLLHFTGSSSSISNDKSKASENLLVTLLYALT
jgi:hypothetical protein